MTLYQAANLSLRIGRPNIARSYAMRAIKANPFRWDYHQTLARVYAQEGDWVKSLSACEEALKLNGLEPSTNLHLVLCQHRLGNREAAQKALEVLIRIVLSQAEDIKRWYAQQNAAPASRGR